MDDAAYRLFFLSESVYFLGHISTCRPVACTYIEAYFFGPIILPECRPEAQTGRSPDNAIGSTKVSSANKCVDSDDLPCLEVSQTRRGKTEVSYAKKFVGGIFWGGFSRIPFLKTA